MKHSLNNFNLLFTVSCKISHVFGLIPLVKCPITFDQGQTFVGKNTVHVVHCFRSKRYREKRKASGVNLTKTKKTRQEKTKQRHYWKLKKRESREKFSSQKKRRIKEYDRLRHEQETQTPLLSNPKKRRRLSYEDETQTPCTNDEGPQREETSAQAKRQALYRVKKAMPKKSKSYADLSIRLLKKFEERLPKKKFLLEKEQRKSAIQPQLKKKVAEYFIREDISTVNPDKVKVLKGKPRYRLQMTLKKTYEGFIKEEGRIIGFSTFVKLKPKNVKNRDTELWKVCLCIKCENIHLKLKALNKLICTHTKVQDIHLRQPGQYADMVKRCAKSAA